MWRSPEAGGSGVIAPGWHPGATAPILLWCDHTASVSRPTGVQRVVRSLARELGDVAHPVGWDRWRRTMRNLSPQEVRAVGCVGIAPASRSDRGGWILFAETPESALASGIEPVGLARALGLRAAALVHDLIPVLAPEPYAPGRVALYRTYLRSLAGADLVLVTTQHVAAQLRRFLDAEELRVPRVTVVPLAAELPGVPRAAAPAPARVGKAPLELLTISRWEPRKNLPLLLRAIERVRNGGRDVRLTLVGRRGGFPDHEAELDAMLARMPWVVAPEETRDPALPALYARHHAAIYPSLDEGFGLPVLESLWCGRTCLHHHGSAMAEVGRGGGTLALDMADEGEVAAVLARLHDDPAITTHLAAEAARRPLRRWFDVATDIRAALAEA